MLKEQLPKTISPCRLAHQGATLRGVLDLSQMNRLCNLLTNEQGSVKASLFFTTDDHNRPIVKINFSTTVCMECQRCLDAVQFNLSATTTLAIIHSESQVDDLPEQYEPLIIHKDDNDYMPLLPLIEDELLLALPLVAYHKNDACGKVNGTVTTNSSDQLVCDKENTTQRNHPFSILTQLKRK